MKKKFWRCHVCNDLHWGFAPPDLCPTCRMKKAYVEVAAREVQAILGIVLFGENPDFTPNDFRRAIEVFASVNEFSVNPDPDRVAILFEGLFENERNHGLKYCPCRLVTKIFDQDIKLICPCNFPTHETYRGLDHGECWCGLFIRR